MAWMANSNFLKMCAGGLARTQAVVAAAATNRIMVYKGTMPEPASYTPASYASDLLCSFSNFSITRVNATMQMSSNPSPADVTATGTGTATWFAMYNDLYIVNPYYKLLLGDVSTNGGTGALYLNTINVVSGNTISFLNFSITFYGV